jgi:hypothetical protein
MALQVINNGSYEDDPLAESIRSAFQKSKENFEELYTETIKITTAVSISTSLLVGGKSQSGKNVLIENGTNGIQIEIVGPTNANYVKLGTGNVQFIPGVGRTLVTVDGTDSIMGAVGKRALLISHGNIDMLYILGTVDNIATANLIFTTNRSHNLATHKLTFTNGRFEVPSVELPTTSATSIPNKVWTDGLFLYLTNNLGINKPLAFNEFTTQVISTGGNYNNLEITADLVVFTNTNAQAIINGVWGKSDFHILNLGSFEVRINHNSSSVLGSGQPIMLPTASGDMGIKGTARILKAPTYGYFVSDTWGSRYRPEFSGLTETEVCTVNPQSRAETMKMKELYVYRDAQATPMTKAQLNTAYPTAERPLLVICPLINTKYELVDNNTKDWYAATITLVP